MVHQYIFPLLCHFLIQNKDASWSCVLVLDSLSCHYLPQFTWKVDQKWNLVKLNSNQTLINITRSSNPQEVWSGHYLPNSHSEIDQKFYSNILGVGSNECLYIVISGHYLRQIYIEFDQKWNYVQLDCSNYSSILIRIILYSWYVPKFTKIVIMQNWSLFICTNSHVKLHPPNV